MNVKNKIILISLIFAFITSGCGMFKINNEGKFDQTFEKFIKYIEKKDSDGIKQLFSLNVQEEVKTLDNDIEYIINLFEGDVVNWEKQQGTGNQITSNDFGKYTDLYVNSYIIESKTNKYIVEVQMYTVDDTDTSNEGIRNIMIIPKDEYLPFANAATCWIFTELPGIYNNNNDYSLEISNAYIESIIKDLSVTAYERGVFLTTPPFPMNLYSGSESSEDLKFVELDEQYLFNFIKGEVESSKLLEGPNTVKTNIDGREKITIETSYDIKTQYENYVIYLLIYQNDERDRNNNGLYSLRVEYKEAEIKLDDAFGEKQVMGIVNPTRH